MNRTIFSILLCFLITGVTAKDYKEITLEKIWQKGTFSQKSVYGLKPMNDGEHYTVLELEKEIQQINKYAYSKGKKVSPILSNDYKDENGNPIRIESYTFSDNEDLILIRTASERIYRHSMRSAYYVVKLSDKSIQRIATGKMQLAEISPNSKYVSYVKENNLYLFDLESKTEKQITADGKKNEIINGAPDWVYEEEFTLVKCYEWSEDSEHIAYYRFDEKQVKEFSFPVYGTLYPESYVYKYPKVGEVNSEVGILIYHLHSGATIPVKMDRRFEYYPRIQWSNQAGMLAVFTMNREQNALDMIFANAESGRTIPVFGERSDTYIEIKDVHFLKSIDAFLWQSEKETGMNTVYLHRMEKIEDANVVNYLVQPGQQISNKGDVVTDIIGFDEKDLVLYYTGSNKYNPTDRMVIKVKLSEPHGRVFPIVEGYGRAVVSKNFKYFISYSSTVNSPLEVKVHDEMGQVIRVLEDNKALKDTLEDYNITYKEFFKFLNRDSMELFGWMIKPPNFDESKKYPVLMYVYGGPGSQTVTNSWGGANDMWYRYLAQKGYIVVSVDNRGTGGRGKSFRDCTYGKLGDLETTDQIDGARYLRLLNYVDENRIGIWGWSYGGYMSTLCLAKGADIFKMAMAVAPVSNWKYYDTIYTERYMGLLKDNEASYDENSPINHVDKIKGNYLLVHGTADDNVHFQNTTELIDALVKSNVQFDLAVYPNKNHGIYGGNTRYHLFKKMSDFVMENL